MKSRSLIETTRWLGNGVDENSTYASNLSSPNSAEDCILQHGLAKATALPAAINGQPANDHHGNRFRHVAAYSAWRYGVFNGTCCKTIIANHAIVWTAANHISPRCSTGFVSPGTTTKPIVEGLLAALELAQIVRRTNRLRCS